MRRAVIQNLRTFRRPTPRSKSSKNVRLNINAHNATIAQRSLATRSPQPLRSSMRFPRRVSIPQAVSVGVVGAGIWYFGYQQGYALTNGTSTIPSLTSTQGAARYSTQTPAYSATAPAPSASTATDSSAAVVPEAVRKALVVDRGQLFTAEIPADQIISKETDYSGRKILEMLTPEQATAKLRTNEESYLVGRGEGVVRYDVVQIPSNDPIEDDHVEKIVEVPASAATAIDGKTSSDWMFWGVFDGHSGWTTSAKLRQTLVSFVARELNATYNSALLDPTAPLPSADSIDAAIKQGFVKLDHEIVHDSAARVLKAQSKPVAAQILAPALSGSCALLSFYDSRSRELRVACTGDSRAVLGRRASPGGKWTATPLSVDQTGGTPSEDARLRAEHPNEPHVTHNGRILGGLEPSRAFGDATYKWSLETQEKLKQSYFGKTPSRLLKTPPYVTAEPIVTRTKIEPEKGDFVVMATDGLWEMLTNEEVVGLVGQWLETQGSLTSAAGKPSTAGWLQSWFSQKSKLPVQHENQGGAEGQRAPIRQQQWGIPSGQDTRFVVEDKNAATHLVRNALGGKDRETVSALLTLPAPYSRRYRDDLTVQVIFFGEGQGNGKVELNKEASATAAAAGDVKAKL